MVCIGYQYTWLTSAAFLTSRSDELMAVHMWSLGCVSGDTAITVYRRRRSPEAGRWSVVVLPLPADLCVARQRSSSRRPRAPQAEEVHLSAVWQEVWLKVAPDPAPGSVQERHRLAVT